MAEVRWRMEPFDTTSDLAPPGGVDDCTGDDGETEENDDGE